ncbi:MAG: hypothetical protein PVH45_00520 [Candidatus Omnitrophota bacterium]
MSEELKKAYQEKVEAQLKEWGNKLENLKIKSEKLGADIKVNVIEKIEDIKNKIQEQKKDLEQLKSADEQSMEKLKSKMEALAEGIKKGINDIMSKF